MWSNPIIIKSVTIDGQTGTDGKYNQMGNYRYTFSEPGEHIVEIQMFGDVIPSGTFGSGTPITSVVIPYGVKQIQYGAFSGNTSLKEVYLPNTIEYIGENAFGGCSNLEKVEIQNGV